MSEIEYRINPLSLTGFMGVYNVASEKVATEYNNYLEQNQDKHHYQGLTQEQWYRSEIQHYISSLTSRIKSVEETQVDEYDQCRQWAR